jgi:hypothetical protein
MIQHETPMTGMTISRPDVSARTLFVWSGAERHRHASAPPTNMGSASSWRASLRNTGLRYSRSHNRFAMIPTRASIAAAASRHTSSR